MYMEKYSVYEREVYMEKYSVCEGEVYMEKYSVCERKGVHGKLLVGGGDCSHTWMWACDWLLDVGL